MNFNPEQIKNLLAQAGIGVTLYYMDQASDPMKKTQQQADKLKASVTDVGKAADDTSRRLREMAGIHRELQQASGDLLLWGGAITGIGIGLSDSLRGAVNSAVTLQQTLISTQFEVGRLGQNWKSTYADMERSAISLANTVGASVQDVANTMLQLGGSFKTLSGIQALVAPSGQLSRMSGGTLSYSDSARLLTEFMYTFFPGQANSTNPNVLRNTAGMSNAMLATMFQTSPLLWPQMQEFVQGVRPGVMRLQALGMGNQQVANQMLALGSMITPRMQGNPVYAGQMASWISNLYTPQGTMSAIQLGLNTLGSNGRPVDIPTLLQRMQTNPSISAYLGGKMSLLDPRYSMIENFLGGMYMSQPWHILLGNGGLQQYQGILGQFGKTERDPQKAVADLIQRQSQSLGAQLNFLHGSLDAFSHIISDDFTTPFAKGLTVVNLGLHNLVDFLNNHRQFSQFFVDVSAVTLGVGALGIGLTTTGKALVFLNDTMGFSLVKIGLFGGAFGLLGLAVAGSVYAIEHNVDGVRTTISSWLGINTKEVAKFKDLFESVLDLLESGGKHEIPRSLWLKDVSDGIDGLVRNIAQFEFDLGHFGQGFGTGFEKGLKPFLDSLGKGGSGESVLERTLNVVAKFFVEADRQNWWHTGLELGKSFGTAAGDVGKFISIAIGGFERLWGFVERLIGFARSSPWAAYGMAAVGGAIGGPIGTALQGIGFYGAATNKHGNYLDPAQGHPIWSGMFGSTIQNPDLRQAYNLYTQGRNIQGSNWFNKIAFGYLPLLFGMPGYLRTAHGILGAASGTGPGGAGSPGMGIPGMAIQAQVVYLYSGNIQGGIPGGMPGLPNIPDIPGAPGGGGLLHKAAHGLFSIWGLLGTIGTIGAVAEFAGTHGGIGWLKNVGGFLGLANKPSSWAGNQVLKRVVNPLFRRFGWMAPDVEEAATGGRTLFNADPLLLLAQSLNTNKLGDLTRSDYIQNKLRGMTYLGDRGGILGDIMSWPFGNASRYRSKNGRIWDALPADPFSAPGTVYSGLVEERQISITKKANKPLEEHLSNISQNIAAQLSVLEFIATHNSITAGASGPGGGGLIPMGTNIPTISGRAPNTVLAAITGQESGGNYRAYNRMSGASGRYQFMPGTAASYLPSWFVQKYGDSITGLGASAWGANEGGVQDQTAMGFYSILEAHAYKLSGVHNNVALIAAGWYGGIGGMDALAHHSPSAYQTQQGGYPSIAAYAASVSQKYAAIRGSTPTVSPRTYVQPGESAGAAFARHMEEVRRGDRMKADNVHVDVHANLHYNGEHLGHLVTRDVRHHITKKKVHSKGQDHSVGLVNRPGSEY